MSFLCWGACAEVWLAQSDAASMGHVILSVAPVPRVGRPSPRAPEVTWATGDGSPGSVTVTPEGGSETLFASSSEGSAAAPWIVAGRSYVFKLYSTASGRRLLARLSVGHAAAIIAVPPKPRITSPIVNRLLQLLSFAAIAVLTVLAAMYIRETRSNVREEQPNV